MKQIFMTIFTFVSLVVHAQSCFTYDVAGNRVKRNVCISSITATENQEFQALLKKENESRSLDIDYDLENLVIYPNPSSGVFQLSNQVNWLESKICVYNQEGKQVYSGSISDQPIDLLFLGSGIYYLTVEKVNTLKVAKVLITK
jgi:hypothetical protein